MEDSDYRELRFLVEECLEDIVRELHRLGCRDRNTAYRWFPAGAQADVLSRGHHFQIKDRETFTLRLDVEGEKHGLEIHKGNGMIRFKALNPITNAMVRECLRLRADTMEIDTSVENTMTDAQVGAVRLLRDFRWDELGYLDKPKDTAASKPQV
jgi:hypothetical protein